MQTQCDICNSTLYAINYLRRSSLNDLLLLFPCSCQTASLFYNKRSFFVFIIGFRLLLNHSPSEWFSGYKNPAQQCWTGFVAPPVGLEPTTLRLTAACSTDGAKEEYERIAAPAGTAIRCACEDLFFQAASRQVSSALVSLTSVFGMGTGGTSP